MKTIKITASKNYDVNIGTGILDDAGSMIRKAVGGQTAAIVTDDNVGALYGDRLTSSLEENGYHVIRYVFPHGEVSKNAEVFLSLINFLAEEKLSRTDVVIALGGGVPGDIAGFAASCYMRGIRFVQVPTTLLAAVDSSVGGKTAVNLPAGKNLLGSFYQPNLVICDVSLLSTLPSDVFKDGCAEVIKYGVIADRLLFKSLETPVNEHFVNSRASCSHLEDVIFRCVEIKRDIVTEDEFESGIRRLLNFGHTIGHAIELLSEYKVSHGNAIAAGMVIETRAAVRMGICSALYLNDILDMLLLYGLPVDTRFSAEELTGACISDKKRKGDSITMVLPVETGRCIFKDIAVKELESIIRLGLDE